jgi:hypothetical protein
MFEQKVVEAYSNVHSLVSYTNDEAISFDGSQIQKEFFEAWKEIESFYSNTKPKQLSFLEVGAWKGLWGLAFCEFCKVHDIEGLYTTITMIDHDPNNRPLFKSLDYMGDNGCVSNLIDMNTFDERALEEVKKISDKFNIVFIDAGHKYHEAKNDIDKFFDLAEDLVLFHDIRPIEPDNSCGVYQAILDSNIVLDREICYNGNIMGIGIKYIK